MNKVIQYWLYKNQKQENVLYDDNNKPHYGWAYDAIRVDLIKDELIPLIMEEAEKETNKELRKILSEYKVCAACGMTTTQWRKVAYNVIKRIDVILNGEQEEVSSDKLKNEDSE